MGRYSQEFSSTFSRVWAHPVLSGAGQEELMEKVSVWPPCAGGGRERGAGWEWEEKSRRSHVYRVPRIRRARSVFEKHPTPQGYSNRLTRSWGT